MLGILASCSISTAAILRALFLVPPSTPEVEAPNLNPARPSLDPRPRRPRLALLQPRLQLVPWCRSTASAVVSLMRVDATLCTEFPEFRYRLDWVYQLRLWNDLQQGQRRKLIVSKTLQLPLTHVLSSTTTSASKLWVALAYILGFGTTGIGTCNEARLNTYSF